MVDVDLISDNTPILYNETATDYHNNGLGKLSDANVVTVTEERNGMFELYMEYPINGHLSGEIEEFRIIRAKPNDKDDEHSFRIYDIEKDLSTSSIHVYAETKTNDLGKNLVKNIKVTDGTPQEALLLMKNNLVYPTTMTFTSDIRTKSSTDWIRRSPLNCIAGEEGSLVQYWGGEIKRTDNMITLYNRRGVDNVTVIRAGKQLLGFTHTVNVQSIVTSILPFYTHTPEGKDDPVTITGSVVESQYIANYPIQSVVSVDYSHEEDVTDLISLNKKASNYFTVQNTGVDLPNVNINLSLVDLSQSSEYTKFKAFENIGLTDTVTVYIPQYDVNVTAKITRLEYNVLTGINQNIEIGSVSTTLMEETRKNYNNALKNIEQSFSETVQVAANGKNRVFRGPLEPNTGMVKNDLWYKPVGAGEIMMYVFDGAYWQLEKVSTGLLAGTLDAKNGDVNLINVNVANIVGETSNFVRSAWNGINSNADMDANRLRFTHTDGTSTEIGKNGFRRITPSDNRSYHYLFYATTFIFGESSSNARWIQLPNDYKGKQFKVFMAIADSMTAPDYRYSIQRFVCTVHPDHSIDYANARVPVISYKSSTLMDGNAPTIDTVQGLLFAIY